MIMTMSMILSSIVIEVIRTVYYFLSKYFAKKNTQALFKYLTTPKNIIKNTSYFHSDTKQ